MILQGIFPWVVAAILVGVPRALIVLLPATLAEREWRRRWWGMVSAKVWYLCGILVRDKHLIKAGILGCGDGDCGAWYVFVGRILDSGRWRFWVAWRFGVGYERWGVVGLAWRNMNGRLLLLWHLSLVLVLNDTKMGVRSIVMEIFEDLASSVSLVWF